MIRYSGLKINIDHDKDDIMRALKKKLRIKNISIQNLKIIKKSLDARNKNNLYWNYVIDFITDNDSEVLRINRGRNNINKADDTSYRLPAPGRTFYDPAESGRICVVGSGPAGLFAAYFLAENGFCPVLIEQGDKIEDRIDKVNAFFEDNDKLDENSNIQFGEGGAGTFSDGKLNTGVNDPNGRNRLVLSTFVKNGAPENILYDGRPHIGSDILRNVIINMREHIISNGGEILFKTKFSGIEHLHGSLNAIEILDIDLDVKSKIHCENLILAPGHSSRDTFRYLINETPLEVISKPFAVGIRIQHPQKMIDAAQYGTQNIEKYKNLPPADYKLVTHTSDGKNIFSFCMCPGGYVINASSERKRLCINGMSYSKRDALNANSAIVTGVMPSEDPLLNIEFQEKLEEKAFSLANGKIPVQRFEDFKNRRKTEILGNIKPVFKGGYELSDVSSILDDELCKIFESAISDFSKKIKGFDDPDALISAVESRTSSPVRIVRDENFEASVKGIFPCGEGAGYAGGITSAAIDGIKIFEEIYRRYFVSVIK